MALKRCCNRFTSVPCVFLRGVGGRRSKREWKLDLSALAKFRISVPTPGPSQAGNGWLSRLVGTGR